MKKLMSLLVAVALVAFMTACGAEETTQQDEQGTEQVEGQGQSEAGQDEPSQDETPEATEADAAAGDAEGEEHSEEDHAEGEH